MDGTDISLRSRFGFRFVMLARHWRQTLNERLSVVGFSDATWAPLVHLGDFGDGLSQKELAARLGLDSSTLVRLLDILSANGQVERVPDAEDRRVKRLILTEKGKAAVIDIKRVLAEAEADMLAGLGDDEIEAMMRAFDKIEGHLSR